MPINSAEPVAVFEATKNSAGEHSVTGFGDRRAGLAAPPQAAFAQRGRRIEQLQQQLKRQQQGRDDKPSAERERDLPPRPNPAEPALTAWLDQLAAVMPRTAADFSGERVDDYRKANDATERWAAELVRFDNSPRPSEMLRACDALLNAKDRVDRLLNQTLELRVGFAAIDAEPRHDGNQ